MRGLVLAATPAQEETMVDFVERHQSTIQKFRVTTTESCLARIEPFLGKNVVAAHSIETAVMGGEAQVATQVVLHDVGAAFVFRDPIVADAAQVDSDALLRLLNVHNIMTATNPATAEVLVQVLDEAVAESTTNAARRKLIPSFFKSLESPAVASYKAKQAQVIAAGIAHLKEGEAKPDQKSAKAGEKPPPRSSRIAKSPNSLGQLKECAESESDQAAAPCDVTDAACPATFAKSLFESQQMVGELASSALAERSERSMSMKGDRASLKGVRRGIVAESMENAVITGSSVAVAQGAAPRAGFAGMKAVRFAERLKMRMIEHHTDDAVKSSVSEVADAQKASLAEKSLGGQSRMSASSLGEDSQGVMQQAKQMRCLALVSHNNMKNAMADFVQKHKATLKRFRLTGTNSTMTMLKSTLGEKDVVYGPTCSSGPLGGDAELGAQMCVHGLGGIIFFTDPLEPHPHGFDISALIRMADLHNLIHASNPTTADAVVHVLHEGLDDPDLVPSFYITAMSPAIEFHHAHEPGSTAIGHPTVPPTTFVAAVVAAAAAGATFGAFVALRAARK